VAEIPGDTDEQWRRSGAASARGGIGYQQPMVESVNG